MSSYARANVRVINEKKNKRKIPMRASHGLKWENKMYKLKRSITELSVRLSNENKIIVYTNPMVIILERLIVLVSRLPCFAIIIYNSFFENRELFA